MNEEIKKEPSAHLFANGNILAFDEKGEQIHEIQKQGLAGLTAFRDKFPEADIYFAEWDSGVMAIEKLHDSFIDKIEALQE